jgi:hypothetical protein
MSLRESPQWLATKPRPERAFRGGRRDSVPRGLQARLRAHRVEAAWLALPLGALAALGEGQDQQIGKSSTCN